MTIFEREYKLANIEIVLRNSVALPLWVKVDLGEYTCLNVQVLVFDFFFWK